MRADVNTLAEITGMRESSGQHCCGRDISADNVTADTAEAGLFKRAGTPRAAAWKSKKVRPEADDLFKAIQELIALAPPTV